MKNADALYLPSRSIEQCQPEQQNHQKIEKLSIKIKQKLIAKTLEAFKPRQNFFLLKTPISKICYIQFLFLK